MDPRTTDKRIVDFGLTSVQFVLASGLALVFFIALINVVVVQYGRGSMRSALDQGARIGATSRSTADCEQRVESVVATLLSGSIGDTVVFGCRVDGQVMVAAASMTIESWTPFTWDFTITQEATSAMEPDV